MKKMALLIQISFLMTITALYAQKLTPYYSYKEALKSIYIDSINSNENFSNDDINSSFSNISDLSSWRDVAATNKVILMGETHYATAIHNLRNRVLFAINTYDYYPLILVEYPYAIVEYFNYYIHLENDQEADSFLKSELADKISTEEDIIFLGHLRKWNKTRKDKPISIGGTDLEFYFQTVVRTILVPYLAKANEMEEECIRGMIALGETLDEKFFSEVRRLMVRAEKNRVIGDYSFMTVQYMDNVIRNLYDTYNALNGSFDKFRQNSIIKKLTNDLYFGTVVKNQKVMLYGGGEHMKSKFEKPENPNFLSEGIYLNHILPETKGKVYSMMVECFAYSYGEMKNRKIEDCMQQGKQYRELVGKLQSSYEKGRMDPSVPYILYGEKNKFLKQISIYYYKNRSVSFTASKLYVLSNEKTFQDKDYTTKMFLNNQIKKMVWYDKYVFMPASEVEIARLKN